MEGELAYLRKTIPRAELGKEASPKIVCGSRESQETD